MLDIRATHYVSPLSEVDFASVPLTVHLIKEELEILEELLHDLG
jgi:hypothetical protein